MNNSATLPSPFASLAGICKFVGVSRSDPDFYKQHRNAIDCSVGFIFALCNTYQSLAETIPLTSTLDVADGGLLLQQAITSMSLSDEKLGWIDQQMTVVLETLLPVVLDPALPEWLLESKWAIAGAFDIPAAT